MGENELDLGPIEERLDRHINNPFFAPSPLSEDITSLLAEVKRLRGIVENIRISLVPVNLFDDKE